MKNNIAVGITLLALLALILVPIFSFWISSFFLFETSNKLVILEECDYEGLRKVIMYEVPGNAITNGAIHISVSDCFVNKIDDSEIIFTASSPNIEQTDLHFKWQSFDTLIIKHSKELKISKQKVESQSVTPKISIKYDTE